jgi:cytochrome P450
MLLTLRQRVINLSQWITHRHPQFWTNPDEFKPERFLNPTHHPYAYFPFAAGPRECVGKNMAIIEAIALLAELIRNFEFKLVRKDVTPRPLITVRPDPGVFMKIRRIL